MRQYRNHLIEIDTHPEMISNSASAEVYLVLIQWPGVHKRLSALRQTRVHRPTTAQPVMEYIPRETTLQLVSMNLCVQETLPVVDALLEEPMIN